MTITRRSAVKNLLIISGGIILLPACVHNAGSASVPLKNIRVSSDEEKLLADIADTIIPKTDTPGAKETMTHIYTLKMIDDCYDTSHQQQFLNGLKEVNAQSNKAFNKNFTDLTSSDKENFLTNIEQKKYPSKDLNSFYGLMKHLTVDGFMTSKYVGTNLIIYEMVPGRFHGSFPINTKSA